MSPKSRLEVVVYENPSPKSGFKVVENKTTSTINRLVDLMSRSTCARSDVAYFPFSTAAQAIENWLSTFGKSAGN